MSIRELSRRFGVHRREVRLALASPVPAERKTVVGVAPVLCQLKPVVDKWLEEERTAPRKQRHTARRVWQRLVAEHDAQVGERVDGAAYVAEVGRRQEVPRAR